MFSDEFMGYAFFKWSEFTPGHQQGQLQKQLLPREGKKDTVSGSITVKWSQYTTQAYIESLAADRQAELDKQKKEKEAAEAAAEQKKQEERQKQAESLYTQFGAAIVAAGHANEKQIRQIVDGCVSAKVEAPCDSPKALARALWVVAAISSDANKAPYFGLELDSRRAEERAHDAFEQAEQARIFEIFGTPMLIRTELRFSLC